MPRIVTIRSKNETNQDVICLILSQDSVTIDENGDPWCGVTLTSEQARSLAERLCSFALEIDNQEQQGYRTSSLSLRHLESVAVVHDGSLQGHRAFQMALEIARRSLAALDLVGIFGIRIGTGEASSSPDDYEWQKGWLSRLVERYGQQAIADGVTLNSILFPANDPCALLDTLYRMRFDLIVIPNGLTRFGNHGERLVPTVISRRNANVLVCP
jgi:hypothetical protein